MLLAALKSQDMYLAGTIVLIQAVLVLVGTLLSDIALAWLDPRIRFSEPGRRERKQKKAIGHQPTPERS